MREEIPAGSASARRSSLLAWIAILAAAILFAWPLLREPSLPGGPDTAFAVASARGFVAALSEGVVYPRWVTDASHGFGAPTFLFYSPLAYYAVGAAHLPTSDLLAAFRLVLLLVTLATGASFYVAARDFSSETGAALGAVLYTLLPYHVLDLYQRFAFAEFAAFVWFPLLFLGARRIAGGRRGAFLLAAAYAGLVLTHLVTAYMVLFVLVPYALFLTWRAGDARPRRLGTMAAAGAVGLLCSAVYLVPALVQREAVHLEWIRDSPFGAFPRNFIYRDETAFGYPPAPIKSLVNGSATWQALLALAAAGLLAARRQKSSEGWIFLGLSVWTLFLQTPLSSPLWAAVPELATVQFPWRFGAFQALAACFLVACALAPQMERRMERRRQAGAVLLLLLVSGPALALSFKMWGHSRYQLDAATAELPEFRTLVTTEYIPKGVEEWQSFADPGEPRQASLAGPGGVETLAWRTDSRRLRVEAPQPATLTLRTFAFSGWAARLDGEAVPIRADNPLHAIEIDVPAGRHEVEVELTPTRDRRIGAALSVLGAILLVVLLRRG